MNDKATGGNIDYCDETYIYNNTVFVDSNYSTAIDMDGLNHHIYNNVFIIQMAQLWAENVW